MLMFLVTLLYNTVTWSGWKIIKLQACCVKNEQRWFCQEGYNLQNKKQTTNQRNNTVHILKSVVIPPLLSDQETVVASAITPDSQSELFHPSELDLLPQFQQMLREERDVLPHYQTPSPSPLDNVIDVTDEDSRREQQHWNLVQSLPEAQVASQELQEEPDPSSIWVQTSPRDPAAENSIQESNNMPSLHQPPSTTVCLMVEDPYFDTLLSSPSSEEAPLDSESVKQCAVSAIFSTPSVCLNDQPLELNPPASGR